MMQKGELIYRGLTEKRTKKFVVPRIQWKTAVNNVLMLLFCFLMGRAVILSEIAPFGVALFANVLQRKRNWGLYLLAAGLGFLSSGFNNFAFKYILAMGAVLLYGRILAPGRRIRGDFHTALGVLLSFVLVNLLYVYLYGFLVYDMIVAVLESIIGFLMVYVFSPVMDLFINSGKRRILSSQETISICIFFSLLITGFWNADLFGLSLKNIVSIAFVLLFSYVGGVGMGAAIGSVTGLILSLSGEPDPVFIGHFAVCGLMAGTFRGLGRLGTGCAFLLSNALMVFYINRSTDVLLSFREIAVSVIILMLIPLNMIEWLKQLFDSSQAIISKQKGYVNMDRLKELTINRLEDFSQVFHKLAQVFSKVSQYNVIKGKDGINKLLDLVASQVCSNCGLYKACWQRNFYSTYNNMFELISIVESAGTIKREHVPDEISKNCFQLDTVLDVLNETYEIYRTNCKWQQKIDECRSLVARQLEGISTVITRLAHELDIDIRFNKDLEDTILVELDKKGIHIKDVTVIEKPNGKIEVNIIKKSCGRRRECVRIIEKALSNIIKKPMSCNSKGCYASGEKECKLQFGESQRYKIVTGISRKTKQYADTCGDNYSSIPIEDGKHMLALSDGMGSGSRADAESSIVVSLLENFLEAGFDLDMTVHTINSVLVLRSREEMFATADLCVVDLVTASTDIVKIGAVSTFIKRKDHVDIIKAPALPMGILEEIQVETINVVLEDGDMIIMVTDGITDSIDSELDQDKWLADTISKCDTRNPQELADFIMEEALKQTNGIANDDMTVMVSRVWKPGI